MTTHKLYDLAREFGPQLGPVTAHLNCAGIQPIEFDVWTGNHVYADDARDHLAKLAGEVDGAPTASAAESAGERMGHALSEEVHVTDTSDYYGPGPSHFARTALYLDIEDGK